MHAWPHGMSTAWTGASKHKAHSENFLPLALRMREAWGSSRSAAAVPADAAAIGVVVVVTLLSSFASRKTSSSSSSSSSSSPSSEADINP